MTSTFLKIFSAIILLLIFNLNASFSFSHDDHSTRLIHNWEFVKGDLGGVWEAVRIETVLICLSGVMCSCPIAIMP